MDTAIIDLIKRKAKGLEMTDDDIMLAAEETEQVIINYCNIRKVPNALRFTWANMAVDVLKSLNADQTGEAANGGPSSLNMGDTTVSFSSNGSSTGHAVDLDSLINNYKAQLQKFRRIKWEPF